jgi:asparagine synthase (glutamine-hydrolysing)
MGGIIGKLSFDANEVLARAVFDRMLDASSRHGAKIRGVFTAPGIALGCCGVRDGLASPLLEACVGASDARNIRAVADSQLINAGELRDTLERGGHRFSTRTDAELIAHAYDRWGTRAFERLRGPFACAVWDDTNRRLVLARDHVGVHCLYFAVLHGHGVVFASDVRALLRDPGVARDWCPNGIDTYLALGYIPAPLTAYRQISKLQPAHYLLVEGRRLHLEEYWDFSTPRTATRCGSVTAIAASLRTAVRHELRHQKHEALLYSGDTASSALLSVAPATLDKPITVQTDQDPAELARSDAAASMLGRIRQLEMLGQPLSSLVETAAATSGEPFADPSAVTQLAICTAAARHAPIALTGHGAAILWGGHDRRPLLSRFASGSANEYAATDESTVWEDRRRRSVYTRGFAWKVRDTNPFTWHLERWRSRVDDAPGDRVRYVNARTLLPDNVLAIAANTSDAAGISLRFPFLDYQMTELAMQTPVAVSRRGRLAMSVIRQLVAPRLPRRLLPPASRQPVRHGWLPPVLTALVPRILLGPRFDGRDIVSRPALRRLWGEHLTARADHSRRLWSLLMLEFWFREFIDDDAAAEPLEYAVLVKAA